MHVNGIELRRLWFDQFDLYSEYHRTSTYDDLTFYSSFPLLMRGIHGYRVISGYLFLFRILMKNSQPERVDSVSVPRNLKGELLDTDSIHGVLARLNGNRSGRIVYVNESVHSKIEGKVPCLRNRTPGRQYVYDNDALSRLEGGDFKNLRKNVNKFARSDLEIVPYERSLRNALDDLYVKWCKTGGTKYDVIWDTYLYKNLMDNFGTIRHLLFVVVNSASSEPVGFFDAVPINQSISVGVFRKILPQYNGAAEYCQVFLARRLSEIGCKYLNDGDDADRPGLRDLKSKFHPIHTFDTFAYKLTG